MQSPCDYNGSRRLYNNIMHRIHASDFKANIWLFHSHWKNGCWSLHSLKVNLVNGIHILLMRCRGAKIISNKFPLFVLFRPPRYTPSMYWAYLMQWTLFFITANVDEHHKLYFSCIEMTKKKMKEKMKRKKNRKNA